jgi:hypothetical protein
LTGAEPAPVGLFCSITLERVLQKIHSTEGEVHEQIVKMLIDEPSEKILQKSLMAVLCMKSKVKSRHVFRDLIIRESRNSRIGVILKCAKVANIRCLEHVTASKLSQLSQDEKQIILMIANGS